MEKGRVEVHNSPGTVLFKNVSTQDLYWYDESAKRKSRRELVANGQARAAYGCRACGLVTLDTTSSLEPRGRKRRSK